MKIFAIIVRILLGLAFVVFGLNAFLQFIPAPPPKEGLATDFTKALFVSHYFYVIAILQIAGGLLLLVGRFVPFGLLLLGPVIVNILLFHIFLEKTGLPIAIVVSVLSWIVLWDYRRSFAPLLAKSPPHG